MSNYENITVIHTDGSQTPFTIHPIRDMIERACHKTSVKPHEIESIISLSIGKRKTIKTSDIQTILIDSVFNKIDEDHPEYALIAGRLKLSLLQKQVFKISGISHDDPDVLKKMYYFNKKRYYRKDKAPEDILSEKELKSFTQFIINNNEDFNRDINQLNAMEKKDYLIRDIKNRVREYPFIMDALNALYLTMYENEEERLELAKYYFLEFTKDKVSLATALRRNLRRQRGNLSSCFIGEMPDDLNGLMNGYKSIARISKHGGGLGWFFGNISPSCASSLNVKKRKPVTAWVRVANALSIVDQGGTKPMALTAAIPWWHYDVRLFLDIKKENSGELRDKAFDIFPQIVVDDFFVEKARKREDVYLFDHHEVYQRFGIDMNGLVHDELYEAHEFIQESIKDGTLQHFVKIKANELWKMILESWYEIGDFYITHKDMLNIHNPLLNRKMTAKCANLCVESFSVSKPTMSWSETVEDGDVVNAEADGMTHVCNLVSINMDKAYETLEHSVKVAIRILDASIDLSTYPVVEAENSAKALRNVGLGGLGWADLMARKKLMYNTPEGLNFMEETQERVAFYAYQTSIELAKQKGAYPLFDATEYEERGLFGRRFNILEMESKNHFPWMKLGFDIQKYGIRNSWLLAIAPNTTSALLMGTSASYLPVFSKENMQQTATMTASVIPKHIKSRYWYYKGRFNYTVAEMVEVTARLQKWVDTGISFEVNINPDIQNMKDISDAFLNAFSEKRLKAIYYVLGIGKGSCEDCAN